VGKVVRRGEMNLIELFAGELYGPLFFVGDLAITRDRPFPGFIYGPTDPGNLSFSGYPVAAGALRLEELERIPAAR
jgi:hypothetical protein